jgi:hypothetical protein
VRTTGDLDVMPNDKRSAEERSKRLRDIQPLQCIGGFAIEAHSLPSGGYTSQIDVGWRIPADSRDGRFELRL